MITQKVAPHPFFREIWERVEKKGPKPTLLRNVVTIPFPVFNQKILQLDQPFIESMILAIYFGDVFILKEAFPKEWMISLRKEIFKKGQETESSFHKMVESVPDFHRIIDSSIAKNYSFESHKHSHYFFPWNNNQYQLFERTYGRWRVIKLLAGLHPEEYEKNTPKDGVVDRIQIVQYPSGTGKIETHSDPYLNQRLILSGIMSKRSVDYQSGGVYFIDKQKKKIDIESKLDIGDLVIYFPTILHGVRTIDEGKKPDWNSPEGRWWFGPFSNSTDMQENRHTGFGVSEIQCK